MKRLLITLLILFLLNAGYAMAKPLGRVELIGRTPSRLLHSDANTWLEVVENLCASYIDGTASQIVCTDDGDGTVTLDFPDAVSITTSLTVPLIYGGTASGGNLTLGSTSHATKGLINFGAAGNSYFDEDQNELLIFGNDAKSTSSGAIIGGVFVGYNGSVSANEAIFVNKLQKTDKNAFAFLQTSGGRSYFNCKAGQFINFSIGNSIDAARLNSAGLFAVGHTSPLAQLHIVPNATTTIGQIIQLAASQSADGWQLWKSDETVLAAFDKDGGLETEGNREKKEIRITSGDSPYTVLSTDHIIFCDTDGGAVEIDLPAGTSGREIIIPNVGSSGNDCTIDPNGTEQIFAGGAGVAFAMVDSESIVIHHDLTEGWW